MPGERKRQLVLFHRSIKGSFPFQHLVFYFSNIYLWTMDHEKIVCVCDQCFHVNCRVAVAPRTMITMGSCLSRTMNRPWGRRTFYWKHLGHVSLMVWLLTYSQTSCIVKSSGPYETLPNKPSGGDGILADLFQILKDDALKVLHSICQQIWKNQQWPQDWKRCFHSNRKERQWQRMCKLLHKCTHLTC